MYEIDVIIKICKFPFGKPSSAAGSSYIAQVLHAQRNLFDYTCAEL